MPVAPSLCFRRTHPLHLLSLLASGCGKGGGFFLIESFFQIPTLIGVDAQPPHECTGRKAPISKMNDDCVALLRKMGLLGRPQHHPQMKPVERRCDEVENIHSEGDQGHEFKRNAVAEARRTLAHGQESDRGLWDRGHQAEGTL